ncbi:MAG: type II secretion system protein GspL [Nitrospirota bacterium]
MRIVGLKIEKGLVAASVVQKDFRRTELVDSFSLPFATDAELMGILKERSKDWTGAKIVSSIPGHLFSQRTLTLPFADRKRIEKALPFEVEDLVPFDLGDVVLDHLVLWSATEKKETATPVLCMLLPKTVLRQHLDLLAGAGIDPQAIVPSFAGLSAVANMMPKDTGTLLLCGADVCFRQSGVLKALRSFSIGQPTGGLRHVLQALEIEHQEKVEKAALLIDDGSARAILAEAGVAVDLVIPEINGKKALDPVSLGIALLDDVNFRKGEFAYHLADEGTRRKRRMLIIAAAVAALLFTVNIAVKFSIVRSGYGKLDAEIKEIYRQTFPDGKPAADPVRQMRDKLSEAKKLFGALGSGSSVLDVMKTVTDGIPKEVRVNFTEFVLESDRLKLQGEASSFESVDKIKAELQKSPLFTEVTVLDTRMGVDNKVKFRFDIKLKQGM